MKKEYIYRYSLNPAAWAKEVLSFQTDEWQDIVLGTTEKKLILNCARQSGKSTVAAILALHRAVFYPDALILLISPSLRQSMELFRKVLDYRNRTYDIPEANEVSKTHVCFENGSRIISLPSSEETVRGYSSVNLIIEDEASRVKDELYKAIRPMLAVSEGQIVLLSTPAGMKGHFYETWNEDNDWIKIKRTAPEIGRISDDFLAEEKRTLGSLFYSQEYLCEFLSETEHAMFKPHWFEIVDEYPRTPKMCRAWDLAATEDGGDYTAGVLMTECNGIFYVLDVRNVQESPLQVENLTKHCAVLDPPPTKIRMEQEPGSSGVGTVDHYARVVLKGHDFKGERSTGPKNVRAAPFSAASEAGNVKLLRGQWNKMLLDQLSTFPLGDHDDMVDAASLAFNTLAGRGMGDPNRFKGMVIR